jgi:hypothetical protein
VRPSGAPGDAASEAPAISADGGERSQGGDSASRLVAASISGDGRRVAFASSSPDLVPDDTNDAQDVFVADLEGPLSLRRVSIAADGRQGDGADKALDPRFGDPGLFVFFSPAALAPPRDPASDLDVTTPTLVYSGSAMPSSATTPPLVFRGAVLLPGGITVPTMVYDGAKTP